MKKLLLSIAVVISGLFIQACTDHTQPFPEPESFTSQAFVSGLKAPIGMAIDDKGNMWVTEAGTGNGNDGSVSMITPSGTKTLYVTGLKSITQEGSAEGIGHLVFHNGKLYFLHGSNGMLYTADVASFKSGDAPVDLAQIPVQDIGTFVKTKKLTDPLNSNTWDLTFGPDGHLYIVDSGANAIVKRHGVTGDLSLFAHFPDVASGVEAVPTGIVYDGTKFLVSTLTGFPFAKDNAKIFQVDTWGNVDIYKSNFTTLTGITLSANNKPIVIHHGAFGQMGFEAKSGKVLDENGKTLLGNISRPTDIIRADNNTYYLMSYQDGTIIKLSY
ncbi:ScyD/ScyE family protein [Dyadobacter chenwenxiniae]|uniref:ScyD/ScyE family protein n=1 Tax=Dyadobacter chenwenxiniae TaxID=2906456 RepID=A0A9X1PR93_9BACT|nr:ScyD/ScyE family protein [Dyadobacter chenwenxiniae]MCF0064649.1 ScyD/ScyE family protein [Dyadobacter chenwenxiniae]UON84296.1 ScyD/ScyE family protein [Dyadobacter chenwenxiniae]